MAYLKANYETCFLQLLELLEDRLADPTVVLVAAPCLGRILRNAPGLSLQALDRQDAISKFANIVKKQKQAEQPKVRMIIPMANFCQNIEEQRQNSPQYKQLLERMVLAASCKHWCVYAVTVTASRDAYC